MKNRRHARYVVLCFFFIVSLQYSCRTQLWLAIDGWLMETSCEIVKLLKQHIFAQFKDFNKIKPNQKHVISQVQCHMDILKCVWRRSFNEIVLASSTADWTKQNSYVDWDISTKRLDSIGQNTQVGLGRGRSSWQVKHAICKTSVLQARAKCSNFN